MGQPDHPWISWTIVYIEMVRRGFRDRTHGMPLFALAFNIAWEFMFAFVIPGDLSLPRIVNITWFLLDAVIVYTYFRYGRRDFPRPGSATSSPGARLPSGPVSSSSM